MLLDPDFTRQHRKETERQEQGKIGLKSQEDNCISIWQCFVHTSFRAHMRVIEPMLFVMVTSVALAKSSFETESRFSLHIMLPKLKKK